MQQAADPLPHELLQLCFNHSTPLLCLEQGLPQSMPSQSTGQLHAAPLLPVLLKNILLLLTHQA